jgi:hypothetical protein
MRKQSPKPAVTPGQQAVSPSPPPDPVDVIAQSYADITGWTRTKARDQLVQIGHAAMRENRAGVHALATEIANAVADQELEKLARTIR